MIPRFTNQNEIERVVGEKFEASHSRIRVYRSRLLLVFLLLDHVDPLLSIILHCHYSITIEFQIE